MSFIGIGFLLGLAGIAIPLAIHFLGKRKKVIQPWGAMRFLDEAKPSWKRRTLRLEDLLVLLLRIGAVALLALAFARPVMKVALPPEKVHEVILVVDRSLSTALGDSESVADEILSQTAMVLDTIPEQTRVLVYSFGSDNGIENVVVASGNPFNSPENRAAWLRSLEDQGPGTGTMDWTQVIKSLQSRNEYPEPLSKRIVLISDAAKKGWPEAEVLAEVPITIVPVGIDHPARKMANLCIDRVSADEVAIQAGKPVSFRAVVTNRGMAASAPQIVKWGDSENGGEFAEQKIPGLQPGESHEVVTKKTFPEIGIKEIHVSLTARNDALLHDNAASLEVEVVDKVRIAVFTDRQVEELGNSALRFNYWCLAAAAGDPGSIGTESTGKDNLYEMIWLTPDRLSDLESRDFDAVIWAVSNPANHTEALQNFVARGGGLWIRLPIEVQPAAFNEGFFPHEYGLSPAGVSPLRRNAEGNDVIGLRPEEDGRFSPAVYESLEDLQVKQHLLLQTPLPDSSEVLLEFEGGKPFVIRSKFGKGEVILSTLDTNPESGNLAASVGYVPLIRELLWHLAFADSPQRNNVPGNFGESDIEPVSREVIDLLSEAENVSVSESVDWQTFLPVELSIEETEQKFEDREIWTWLLLGLLGFVILEVLATHHLLSRRRAALASISAR